jgi:phosphopantothenoylcysteine decarboxylase / phosphopantothenate---cysteine ligase
MNDRMYRADATQANLQTLASRGVDVIEPGEGRLASKGEHGVGRLPEPAELLSRVEATLPGTREGLIPHSEVMGDLGGLNILVTAGGTREPIDPVRYIGNRSSGRMGFALAERARARGARVTVVAANVSLPTPERVERVDVESTADLAARCHEHFPACDVLLMAAAPADFTVVGSADEKLSRSGGGMTLELEPTEDILGGLSQARHAQTMVGFAAQFGGDAIGRARQKLDSKGADMIVLNDVSDTTIGFDSNENAVTLVTHREETEVPKSSKLEIADRILDQVIALRGEKGEG